MKKLFLTASLITGLSVSTVRPVEFGKSLTAGASSLALVLTSYACLGLGAHIVDENRCGVDSEYSKFDIKGLNIAGLACGCAFLASTASALYFGVKAGESHR